MSIGTTDFKCIYSATTYQPQTGSGVIIKENQLEPINIIQTSVISGKRSIKAVGDYYSAKITIVNAGAVEIDQWTQTLKNKVVDFYPRSGGSWHFNAIIKNVVPFSINNIYGIDAVTFDVISTDYVTYPVLTPP